MIKKDHNTGVSNGIKKFLIEILIKDLKNGALSRNLIKSIKKYFIKNLVKNPKKVPQAKKTPYQKKNFIKKLKMPYHKT